jgi:hypothetical protein
MMHEEGLLQIDVNMASHAVMFVYEPGTEYDIDGIKAYVEDMCDGKSQDIMIYEGTWLTVYLHRQHGAWIDIADRIRNGV